MTEPLNRNQLIVLFYNAGVNVLRSFEYCRSELRDPVAALSFLRATPQLVLAANWLLDHDDWENLPGFVGDLANGSAEQDIRQAYGKDDRNPEVGKMRKMLNKPIHLKFDELTALAVNDALAKSVGLVQLVRNLAAKVYDRIKEMRPECISVCLEPSSKRD
jgi:hypothetical protein